MPTQLPDLENEDKVDSGFCMEMSYNSIIGKYKKHTSKTNN